MENSDQRSFGEGQIPMDQVRLLHELHTHQMELQMQNEELRRSELRLRQTSKRFSDLYDFAPVGYFTLTRRGVIKGANLKGSSFMGLDRIHLIGTLFIEYLTEESQKIFTQHLQELTDKQVQRECEIELRRADKKIFFAHIHSGSWHDIENGSMAIRSVMTDITQRRQLEAAMMEACNKADQANQAKSQFLANMSHEIRTPLGVILGFSEILIEEVSERQHLKGPLLAIRRNGEHLLNIINEILDLSKVEAGRLEIEKLLVNLQEQVQEVVCLLQLKANSKNLEIHIEKQGDLPDLIYTDPTRFRQILLNLIGNAIKFTESGSVILRISMLTEKEKEAMPLLCIDVCDTGCGISQESQACLFKAFSQADASTTRKYGGTGLGLVLSQYLAKAMGGDVILLSSEQDRGSVFRLTLNLSLEETESAQLIKNNLHQNALPLISFAPQLQSTLTNIQVLVIEDMLDNLYMLKSILESSGAFVHCAHDGFSGVSRALSHSYDIVLMDLDLPGISGFDAMELLRKNKFDKPILAVSAHASQEDLERVYQSGFNGFLSKPLDKAHLVREILNLVKKNN